MRICTNDGFRLLGGKVDKTSVKKFMLCRSGAKDNQFHKSIEHGRTSFCLEVVLWLTLSFLFRRSGFCSADGPHGNGCQRLLRFGDVNGLALSPFPL